MAFLRDLMWNVKRIIIWVAVCSGLMVAQIQASTVPDFSGFWERKDEVGGGNFAGTFAGIPQAALRPEVIE